MLKTPAPTMDDLTVVRVGNRSAEISIDTKDWRGYTFKLTLDEREEDFSSVEILRDGSASALNSWRLQHLPIGLLKRAMLLGDAFHGLAEVWREAEEVEQYRPNRDELKLAKLARAYVETLGEPHQSQVLAERLGYRPNSIAKLIRRARERHLLTATTKGTPGGVLTPKALVLLGQVTPEAIEAWAEAPIAETPEVDPNEILKGMQDLPGGELVTLSDVEPASGATQRRGDT